MERIYSREEVYAATLKYFNGDELATNTWLSKYVLKDKENNFLELTPVDMHQRLAKEFARIENKYNEKDKLSEKEIFELFKDFKYIIPGGSIMSGLGNSSVIGSYSNCFVVGAPEDSYSGIMLLREEQTQLMKRRGGVGKDISTLRPYSSPVNNAAKTSTGAVSFMDVDSALTNEVAQNGRRGALMITMDVRHPDIKEFITKKQDLTKVTGANISVKLTDDFMEAVRNNEDYILRFPIDSPFSLSMLEETTQTLNYNELITINPCENIPNGIMLKRIKARDIWDTLVHCAWNTGEPGVMFSNKHHDLSPDGVYNDYRGITTNPCGEIFMQPYDSCRLIHINFSNFVINQYTDKAVVDYNNLYRVSRKCLRLADDLVDLEIEAVDRIIEHIKKSKGDNLREIYLWDKIKDNALKGRRCGVGFTGLGDMLAKLGIKFDSEEALSIVEKVMQTKLKAELNEGVELAKTRGSFYRWNPAIEKNMFYNAIATIFSEEHAQMCKYGRRNVSWSTVAPTGTVSIMARSTSGIEPLFLPFYMRRKKCMNEGDRVDFVDKVGEKYTEFPVIHPEFEKWIKMFSPNIDINGLKEEEINDLFSKSPWYGSTANDIDWENRVKLQAIVQKYTTHSISSTINLPKTVSEELIGNIYQYSWDNNLKGITVYRDGCRDGILNAKTTQNESCFCENNAPKRPKSLPCKLIRFNNNKERWIAVIGLLDGRPYEIFSGLLEKLDIPGWVEDAFIVKVKIPTNVTDELTGETKQKNVSRYDIQYKNKNGDTVNVEGISNTFKEEYWNYAKLISGILRHGMPINSVINVIGSLNLNNDNLLTWQNGIIRALKRFQKDGELTDVCPECGSKLWRENGCTLCKNCGFSGCS
jgi:ribonucleoside-diphosphate reductase alpha chain